MQTDIHFWSHFSQLSLEWEMFQTKVVDKIRTHFVLSNIVPKTFRLWENVEEYGRAGQATDGSMAQAHWLPLGFAYLKDWLQGRSQ